MRKKWTLSLNYGKINLLIIYKLQKNCVCVFDVFYNLYTDFTPEGCK